MCKLCGCAEVVRRGKEAILQRLEELVKELCVTHTNVDDYECLESISSMIAPLGSKHREIYKRAAWIRELHEGMPHEESRIQKYVQAYDDLYARLPVQGEREKISLMYHQLEQLVKKVNEDDIAPLDRAVQEGIKAVLQVHEDKTRAARLRARFGL